MSNDMTGQDEPLNEPAEETQDVESAMNSQETTNTVTDETVTETTDQALPENAPPVEDAPVEDAPVEDAPVEDAPVSETPPETASTEITQAEPEQAAAEAPPEVPQQPARQPHFGKDDLIEGTIVSASPTEVLVDLGDEWIGFVSGRELERMPVANVEALEAGQTITVYVVNPKPRGSQGRVMLSINRAQEQLDWKEAERYQQEQLTYQDNVAGYNKGGLIVRFGRLRGFVPQSQISDERRARMEGETPEERYGPMVNDEIFVKVMEVDTNRNRLILSERAASRELRERRKAELIEQLTVGQVFDGRVVSLEDFGAFVDIGGAEGLVHLTEISWKHVNHPRDVLKVGQILRVEVINVDRNRKRIGLSSKRQEADPWDEVAAAYEEGDLVQAQVTKLTKFGAFAQLEDKKEIEGLIHISELSENRVNHPREVVAEGEKLNLRVVKIDVKNRRLGLSLKRVNSPEFLDHDMKRSMQRSDE